MRVLAFTPVYRLEPETVQAICTQDYGDGFDALFGVDNPHSQADRGKRNVLHQYSNGRDTFLRGDWAAMWIVESDIIPPPNALSEMVKIMADGADVVYLPYLFRQPWPKQEVTNITKYNPGAPDRGHVYNYSDKYRPVPSGIIRCSGSGLGCVLVSRAVAEAIPFRHGDWRGHCDTHWNTDVYKAGYVQMANMNLFCGHKTPEGNILWPQHLRSGDASPAQ